MLTYDRIASYKLLLATTLFSLFLTSCEREIVAPQKAIAVKGSTDVITPYYFDWDNADFMPTPPGYTIYVPWSIGATGSINGTYDADVWSDHYAADGWIMLYSTFSPSTYSSMPYFILYNRYRGLMRIYQYNDNSGLTTSSYLQDGLAWAGNGNGSDKVLDFLGRDFVDINTKQTLYTAIQPGPINGDKPVAPNKWYMLQYELAYDPAVVPTTSNTPPLLSWYLNYYDITDVTLGGTWQGTLNGTIGSSTLQQSISGELVSAGKNFGRQTLSALGKDFFGGTNKMGFENSIFNILKTSVESAMATTPANLPGSIMNIFSAVVGGKTSGTQTLKADINATLSLKGTNTNQGSLLPSTSIAMPGSLAQDANGNYYYTAGYVPLYNKNLGVFSLKSKPTVYKTRSTPKKVYTEWGVYYDYTDTYTKNNSAILSLINFNPALFNSNSDGATYSNLTYEVIIENIETFDGGGEFARVSGRLENHHGNAAYTNKTSVTASYRMARAVPATGTAAIRISFNVVPNNGGPISTIAKTFHANVVNQ